MPDQLTDHQKAVIPHGRRIMRLAVQGDTDGATSALADCLIKLGRTDATWSALAMTWMSALGVNLGIEPGQKIQPAWLLVPSGTTHTAESPDLPEMTRWAGQLTSAWLSEDGAMCAGLWTAVAAEQHDDPERWIARIGSLLSVLVATARRGEVTRG